MVGSQAIVAFFHSNGSMVSYPTRLDSYAPSMAPEALSFPVSDVSTEYVNKEMIIFATLGLVGGGSKFNHVWQEGSTVLNDVPKAHSITGENIQSLGTIDFQ
ncbi:putative Cytochrome b561 and DOMON domain-containing protein [Cocos nucifera]|nr:putative Cytochrome b561 and DOMON domain-containing protein [Cocos nucifera]